MDTHHIPHHTHTNTHTDTWTHTTYHTTHTQTHTRTQMTHTNTPQNIMPNKLQQSAYGLSNNGGPQMSDMHFLGNVGRGEINHNLQFPVHRRWSGSIHQQIFHQLRNKGGFEEDVDEPRASYLTLCVCVCTHMHTYIYMLAHVCVCVCIMCVPCLYTSAYSECVFVCVCVHVCG